MEDNRNEGLVSRLRLDTIRVRLLLAFIAVALLPVIAITLTSAVADFQGGYTRVINHFNSVTELKAAAIDDWLQQLELDLRLEVGSPYSSAATLLQTRRDSASHSDARRTQAERFEDMLSRSRRFYELSVVDSSGTVVLSTLPSEEGKSRSAEPYFEGGMKRPGVHVIAASDSSTSTATSTVIAVSPVINEKGRTLGVVVGRASSGTLDRIMSERTGLGETAETYLVGQDNLLLTASHFPGYVAGKNYVNTVGANAALRNRTGGSAQYDDYRGVPVLGVYRWIPNLQAALLAEVDRSEALRPVYTDLTFHLAVALAAILVAIVVSVLVAGGIARPIASLARTAEEIAAGDLHLTAAVEKPQEVGTLARAFNGMTARLRVVIADLEQRIAELDTAGQELRESEAQYRRIVDTTSEGIWVIGPDGIVTFANSRMAEMLGSSLDDVLGHSATDFMFKGDVPDHRRVLEDRRRGMPGTYERRLRRKDGQITWTSVSATPIFDDDHVFGGSIAMLTDITERRHAEEELRASQRKLTLHLEQTLLGVMEFDTEFRIREWNPAAEAIFGYGREEAIGRLAQELIVPPSVRPQVGAVFQKLLHQSGGRFNTNENVTRDGRTILCEWINTPLLDDAGTVVGVMAFARDITEHRQAEQLRVAKEAAEAASLAKSSFLANMSHEIRTPLNAILGFSQLMRRDGELSQRQREQLDIINSSGEHLLALINDILEMSKVEAGRLWANTTAFNLHALLDEMDSLFGLRAQAKGVALHVIRSDEVPRFVVTDENKLRQVLVNLLGNAVKFTDEGHIEVRVGVNRDEDSRLRLRVDVEDTGLGIAPEDMQRLFHHFEQVGRAQEANAGTGLGLAISREFVQLLGGEIVVASELGIGSTFRFDMRIEEATAEAVADISDERHILRLRPEEPRYRILVADDARDNRELLVQLLEPVGFDVRSVADGQSAVQAFEEWLPQLVLMDMRMPVMDGYEATRRIRRSPQGARVAIIGVTASVFSEMRQGVYDAGVDEFIGKPFHASELFGKIGRLLGVRYVYEEGAGQTDREAVAVVDAAALAELPTELISRLKRATLLADFEEVLLVAEEIERHDSHLATELRALAQRFDSGRILDALPELPEDAGL